MSRCTDRAGGDRAIVAEWSEELKTQLHWPPIELHAEPVPEHLGIPAPIFTADPMVGDQLYFLDFSGWDLGAVPKIERP